MFYHALCPPDMILCRRRGQAVREKLNLYNIISSPSFLNEAFDELRN